MSFHRLASLLVLFVYTASIAGCLIPTEPDPDPDPDPDPMPMDTGPTAAFTADETNGPAPTLIQFTDQSTPGTAAITQWAWDFGDGLESTAQNPVHDYGTPGTYAVSLQVTTAVGTDTETQTDYITIEAVPPVMPSVVAPTGPVTGSAVTLTGTTTAEASLLITGGVANVTTTADAEGAFSVAVAIAPNRISRLFLTATLNGLSSPPVPEEISQDNQAPNVFIDFPADGMQITEDSLTVAGRVADMLSGFDGLTVSLSGLTGNVASGVGTSGTFEIPSVPLVLGDNILEVVATDGAGNSRTDTITVTRVAPTGDRLNVTAGNGQSGMVRTALEAPIQVTLQDENGAPIVGRVLSFRVVRSDGLLDRTAAFDDPALQLSQNTDAAGLAQVYWKLGADAGCGNNRVRVRDELSGSEVTFCASAEHGAPNQLNLVMGNNQRAATGGMAPDRLRVRVSDGDNGVAGVMVDFMAMVGGGQVNDQIVATVESDANGIAEVAWVMGENAGEQMVVAEFDDNMGAPVFFEAFAVAATDGMTTTLSGIVLDNASLPVGGAPCELEVNGEAVPSVVSGADGRFIFEDIPAGQGHLHVGGLQATQLNGATVDAGSFPDLEVAVTVVANAANSLPSPVLLPMLDPTNARSYDGTADVELTVAGIEGLRMIVRAGSMRYPDGSEPSPSNPATLALNQVQTDDIPMPLPNGVASPFAWTLQPSGATFDPPVEIVYPNMAGLAAGTASFFLSFNHDTGAFEVVGTGAVSDDASEIVTDRGSGISVAGWGGNCPPYSVTGEVKSCEANLGALLKESVRFLIALVKDVNKITKIIACGSDIIFRGPDCYDAYVAFRDLDSTSSQLPDALSKSFACVKSLKVIANNCLDVFLPLNPFEWASKAKILSDALSRALAFGRANDCFLGTSGEVVLKTIDSLNNLANPFIDLAANADPKKAALAATCAALQSMSDIFAFGAIVSNKGEHPLSDEQLAELDRLFADLPAMVETIDDTDEAILAIINAPSFDTSIQEIISDSESALDTLTSTELAGFTVMVSNQISLADEFGLVDFGNITIPDEFGPGGPGTAPDFIGDDILHLLGFKETETGTRYVYSTPFQIRNGEPFALEFDSLTFSDEVPPFPQTVALSATALAIPENGTSQLRVTGTFFNGDPVDLSSAADGTTYRVSNPDIINVSGDGLLSGVSTGTAYVTATNFSATAVRRVTVSNDLFSTTVEGQVLDFNGDPVVGAIVTTALGGEAITDETGSFTLNLILPTGTAGVTLNIQVEDDAFNSDVLAVVVDGLTDAGTLEYIPSDAMTTVLGTVNRSTGDALAGATVISDQGGEGITDETGAFSFAVTLSNYESITVTATFEDETESLSGRSEATSPVIEGTTDVGMITVNPAIAVLYPRKRIQVDTTPGDLAVADFNGDDILDVITANEVPDTLSLALGQGDGSFALRTDILIGTDPNFGIGINPDAIVAGDFNEDGAMDVVTANLFGNSISFVPGNGQGSFGAPTEYASGISPQSVVAADFNGDDQLDVATPNTATDDVSIFLGNGDGTFDTAVHYTVGDTPRFLRAADFNGDNVPDLAAANSGSFGGTVSVLLGAGDGTFGAQMVFSTGSGTDALATGDFDKNGTMDIAANRGGLSGDIVGIYSGNGDGTFTLDSDIPLPSVNFLESVDLDEDGNLDLLVSFIGQQFGVQILNGAGDGTFTLGDVLDGAQFPDRVVPADLNDDGSLDLALVNTQSDDVSIFLASADGVFDDGRYAVGARPFRVELNHMDSDANLDAVVLNGDNSSSPMYSLSVLLGGGDGQFMDSVETTVASEPVDLATGDLNGDTLADALVSRCCDGAVDVLLSDGMGGFSSTTPITVGTGLAVLALGDIDGDGELDLVSVERFSQSTDLTVRLGNGDGTFADSLAFVGAPNAMDIILVDMNGDESLDAVVGAFAGIYIAPGNGDGTFTEPSMLGIPGGPMGLAIGDVNNDGNPDVAMVASSAADLLIALGNGDGTLAATLQRDVLPRPTTVSLYDVNDDGRPDAIVGNELNNSFEVYVGRGDGTFADGDAYGAGQQPVDLVLGDLNGDALPDVVTAHEAGGDIGVSLHE